MIRIAMVTLALALAAPAMASADSTPWTAMFGKARDKRERAKMRVKDARTRFKRSRVGAAPSMRKPATSVPELSGDGAFAGAALLLGGAAVLTGRRRRRN